MSIEDTSTETQGSAICPRDSEQGGGGSPGSSTDSLIANRRLIQKDGTSNIKILNQAKKNLLKDIFTTVVDCGWGWTLLAFACSFMFSWLFFGVCWFVIAYVNDDLGPLPDEELDHKPCINNVHNFASCFLFSVETQHTIGYGGRSISEECPHAIILMCLQSMFGVLASTCMAGIVFAKLARPMPRSNTIAFSKNAVITFADGCLQVWFRVGNFRTRSNMVESHFTVKMVTHHKTGQMEDSNTFRELRISTTHDMDHERAWFEDHHERSLLTVPCIVKHRIDEESPFFSMTPEDLLRSHFELVVYLEGIVQATGCTLQKRTSYLPREILWGYTFEHMVNFGEKRGKYEVDCSYLNAVKEDGITPRTSMELLSKDPLLSKDHETTMEVATEIS